MSPLVSMLNYIIAHVPRYKGLMPALESFPILNKQLILSDLASHLSDELEAEKPRIQALLQCERLPGDGKHDFLYGSKIFVEETSGSSGIPFRIPKTIEERTRLSFNIWKNRRTYDHLFTPKNSYPFDHAPANLTVRGNPNDLRPEKINQLYTNLSSAQVRWVYARARVLYQHAEAISESVATHKTVCFAENTGYSLSAEDRQFIEAKLKVSLVDQYACREVWTIGTRKDDGPFKIMAENVIVELLDNDDIPITRSGVEGRIVVTSLHQHIFPIVRYDTSDIGMWVGETIGHYLQLAGFRRQNILRFGKDQINGNDFTRSVLKAVHKVVGYSRLDYIQIRQLSSDRFALAVRNSTRARALCDEINICWNSRYPHPVIFELVELSDKDVEKLSREKPALFTTKYLRKDALVRASS